MEYGLIFELPPSAAVGVTAKMSTAIEAGIDWRQTTPLPDSVKDDAMSLFLEGLSRMPAVIALCPVLAGPIAAVMAKQEDEQLLPCRVRNCLS